ncbi:MAG TPA: hypothetical protein VGR21_01820 [Cryptosporangiaceae bacterium]|nr:hypothetical protein [Cryptosporangiaceae bacterium]
MTEVLLAVGTRKGLFLGRSHDRRSWTFEGPHFAMNDIYAVAIDQRGDRPRLLVGAQSEHWGPGVSTSDDLGKSWQEPAEGALTFPADTGAALARVWQLTPAPPSQPGVVWAGTEPSALFRSDDGGEHFSLVRGLWDHPHRPQWHPGGGGQAIHTILPHPSDPAALTVAMSTGGVYRTADGGQSWEPANKGVAAPFLPDPVPEWGQCVHKVARHPSRPEQLFLQNHGGVYRSDDGGDSWTSIAGGLPADFGFPIVVHPRRPGVAYVFPLTADMRRIAPEERARVYRTEDAGETWSALGNGLPTEHFYETVLRDAMTTDDADPVGVYFGTRGGSLFASADEGESWQQLAGHFPDVMCLRAAVLA